MTDKEKLEKLAEYLVRRMYAHNQMADIGSTGEIFDEKIENAKYEECRDTLNFIDSMQEEPQVKESAKTQHVYKTCKENGDSLTQKSETIDFEQELYKYFGQVKDFTLGMRIAKRFYEIGRNYQESVSNDLDAAIDTYLATYFGGEKEKQDWPFLKKMAIHFANWRKEQMMKDAVTAEVRTVEDFMGTTTFRCVCDKYKVGDKVKLVIIKEG